VSGRVVGESASRFPVTALDHNSVAGS
jgi:hypothetical protein